MVSQGTSPDKRKKDGETEGFGVILQEREEERSPGCDGNKQERTGNISVTVDDASQDLGISFGF